MTVRGETERRRGTGRRALAAALALMVAGGALAGCGKKGPPKPESGDESKQEQTYPKGAE